MKIVIKKEQGMCAERALSSGKDITKTVGGIIAFSWRVACREQLTLPALLPCEPLVEQDKHLGDVELDVFQIKVFLVVLLHLEQVV
jgi:hypothetical protein